MSGTGTKDFGAPAQLSTISGDQPLGSTVDGNPVMPSFYLLQFLQRLLSYIGQPVNNSGVTLTVTAQEALATAQQAISMVTNLQSLVLNVQSELLTGGADVAGLLAVAPSSGLTAANIPGFLPAMPAVGAGVAGLLPAAPRTGLTQAQVLALQTFTGGAW